MPQVPHGRTAQALACLIVATLHIALFWLLALKPRQPDASAQQDGARLTVRWLPRPPAPAPVSPPPSAMATAPAPPIANATPPPRPAFSDASPAQAVDPETGGASAAELARQAAAWAAQSSAGGFDADPLRNRRAQLPGGDQPGRFAMRPPPSPQRTLRKIGQGLAGSGYTTDPCPEIRDSLAGLMTDTSDAGRRALHEQVDLDRRHCRP